MNHVSEKVKQVSVTIQSLQDCYDKIQNPTKKEEIYNIIYQLQQLKSSVEINKNYLPGPSTTSTPNINVKPITVPPQPSLQLPMGTTMYKVEQKQQQPSMFTPTVVSQSSEALSEKMKFEIDTTANTAWEQEYKGRAQGKSFTDKNQVQQWVQNDVNLNNIIPSSLRPYVAHIIAGRIIEMKHLQK